MNQTDAIAATPADGTAIITTAHLVIIILLAVAAMLIIWWGGRRRARERAEREASHTETVVAGESVPPTPVAPPVTPPPPPLVEDAFAAPAPIRPTAAEPAIPASRPAPVAAVAAVTGEGDAPVTLLKGLGPKVAARLGELGITTVGQIAALSPAEADTLDADLGAFRGRMARDRWIEQAQLLAAGDRAGYEATFGKLG